MLATKVRKASKNPQRGCQGISAIKNGLVKVNLGPFVSFTILITYKKDELSYIDWHYDQLLGAKDEVNHVKK